MSYRELYEILSQISHEQRQGVLSLDQAEAERKALFDWFDRQRAA